MAGELKAFGLLFSLWALPALTALGAAAALEPFFDEDPTTKHAPEDPDLTDLDLDVLELCGDWGAPVDARAF